LAVHLRLAWRRQQSTGTLAYNLVCRGDKFGVRLLGTVKKWSDVTILTACEI